MQPWSASFLKQMRQMPNFWYTARGRPQSMQRRTSRVENLGFCFAAAIFDLLAMVRPSSIRSVQRGHHKRAARRSTPASVFSRPS
jgi:hypothetical protein